MNSSVYVYRNGKAVSGKKVVLGFGMSGMTSPSFTDSSGCATITHSSKGRADVYVDGKKQSSFTAPGSATVSI